MTLLSEMWVLMVGFVNPDYYFDIFKNSKWGNDIYYF